LRSKELSLHNRIDYHPPLFALLREYKGEQNPQLQIAIDTDPTSQPFHNKRIPTARYTQINSNSTTRADGSRSEYVKIILLISKVLFPKYFIITKSRTHWLCFLHFPIELQHNLIYVHIFVIYFLYIFIYFAVHNFKILLLTIY